MKKILVLLVFCSVLTSSHAQDLSKLSYAELDRLMYIEYNKGAYDKAIPYMQAGKDKAKAEFGGQDSVYAQYTGNLGFFYENIGNYKKAETFYLEAIAVRKKALGEQHPDYAQVLNNLAGLYMQTGEYTKAEPLMLETIRIWKKTWGEDHADYGHSLNNLAALYCKMGNYTRAEPLYVEVLVIWKKALGDQHPDYTHSLNNLAALYTIIGNYAKAEPLYLEAVGIRKKTMKEHAQSVNNLANLYRKMGNYAEAEALFLEAMSIRRKALGTQHVDYAHSLHDLATLYSDMGNYVKVEPLLLEAIAIRKKMLGNQHPDYANSLNNLAALYRNVGNYTKAESLLLESMAIRKKTLGEQHPDYASSLNNLAALYSSMESYTKAESLYLEAIAIEKKTLGVQHLDYSSSLNNLATLYVEMTNFTKAEPLLLEAMDIRKKILGDQHPDYATILNSLANLYGNMSDYYKAESFFLEAVDIWKKNLGELHPTYALGLNNLANLYSSMDRPKKAKPLYEEAFQIKKNNLSKNFTWLSEKEKNTYWQKEKDFYESLNSFAAEAYASLPSSSELAYQGNLVAKSLLLETSRELDAALKKSNNPTTIRIYAELKEKRQLHTELLSKGVSKKDLLDQLEQEADSLDKILVGRMGEYATSKRKFETSWKDVQAALKSEEAAIEFARYYNEKDSQYHYLALVLQAGHESPKTIKLGTEKAIAAIPSGKGFGELYKLIWEPMDALFAGVKTIYYSPVGYLNNIAFAALCSKDNNINCVYLSDQYTLHQLSTTRYLAEGLKHHKIENSMLLFGGVDYDEIPTKTDTLTEINNESYLLQENINNRSSNQSRMEYLPGTQTELESIQETLNRNHWKVRAFSDKNASENTLKSELNSKIPSVLHIATHGFAFPDVTEQKESKKESKKTYRDADNPMLRCGLLFAGANSSWIGDAKSMLNKTGEDGILTALEVSNLSLGNTKLVVLSACETGLGKIEGSEGTFGLKRGFKLAGVDNIIVSLWSVPDKETMELMHAFYTDLAKTKDPVLSFEKAQKEMQKKYKDRPDLWAGFVLVR